MKQAELFPAWVVQRAKRPPFAALREQLDLAHDELAKAMEGVDGSDRLLEEELALPGGFESDILDAIYEAHPEWQASWARREGGWRWRIRHLHVLRRKLADAEMEAMRQWRERQQRRR